MRIAGIDPIVTRVNGGPIAGHARFFDDVAAGLGDLQCYGDLFGRADVGDDIHVLDDPRYTGKHGDLNPWIDLDQPTLTRPDRRCSSAPNPLSCIRYRIAYGEAARLAEVARYDHAWDRVFTARIEKQGEKIQANVTSRIRTMALTSPTQGPMTRLWARPPS